MSTSRVLSFPEPSGARFDLRCWGEFSLFDRQQQDDSSPRGRKARAIIAYLASQGGSLVSRERLTALLWSERGDQQARASLRQTLLKLKPYATDASRLLVIDHDHVHLNMPLLTSDVARMEAFARHDNIEALAQALSERGERLYGGLDGLDPALDEWLALERSVQLDRLLSLGAGAAERGLQRGEYEPTSRLATQLQALDETNEAIAQIGMRADQACGHHSAVRRRHRRLSEALQRELGVKPSVVTEALLSELTRSPIAPPVAREPAQPATDSPDHTGSGISLVAMLPITHRGGGEEMEFLAEDLTEEITRDLAQNNFFKVIAAGTMAAWRGKTIDHRTLGRRLGARYLVDGKLQRAGDNVRLTVQVIDADTGNVIISPRFDRASTEIATSPDDFPAAVASQLGEHILQIELNRAMTKQGALSGWEHLLRAHAYPTRLGSDNLRGAVQEARDAVAATPDVGLAHAMLAGLLGVLTTFGLEQLDDALRREIHGHLREAMRLDGDNAAVLTASVNAYAILGDEEASVRLARRAAELTPNSVQAQFALGRASISMGRMSEAIAAFNQQLRLAPQNYARLVALQFLGLCYCVEGKFAEAEAALDEALALHPDYGGALRWKAVVAARQGQDDVAKAAVVRLRRAEPAMSIDRHVRSVTVYPLLRERTAAVVATLRQLWEETGGEAS